MPKPKWKTVEVQKVIDNERFMLKNQQVIRIVGVKAPDIFLPQKSDKCYARPIYRTLNGLIANTKVKIFEDFSLSAKGEFIRHVKLMDGTVLTTYMLERGMARFDDDYTGKKYFKIYKSAESRAKKAHLGVWHGCNPWNNLKMRRRVSGRLPFFWTKYYLHLSSVSVGRVKKVLSGNLFRLDNGLTVKLIGVEVPDIKDNRPGYACFSTSAKEYLESLILGKKVRLVRDRSQLDFNSHLLRYVYLPQTRYRNQIFVNKKLIQDGYGKSVWSSKDDRFKSLFQLLQKQVYHDPHGAWSACFSELLATPLTVEKESEESVLVYDETCRIKGNISGSKKNPIKTYHTPKSGWYKRIKPEKCFTTEDEALEAGFRKIK